VTFVSFVVKQPPFASEAFSHKRASYPFTFVENPYISVFFPYKNVLFRYF